MMKHVLVALATFPMIAGATDLASSLAPGTLEVTGFTLVDASTGSSESRIGGASETVDYTDFNLLTGALYYVLRDLGLGLHAGYGYSKSELLGSTFRSSDYSVGPLVSYAVPVAPQLALVGSADGSWIRRTSKSSGRAEETSKGYGFGLQAGVKYFPAKPVSLDAGLAWRWQRVEVPGIGLFTGTSLTTGTATVTATSLGLRLGVSVYFGGGR
jgi:opacity protein-like surface antigen